MPHGAHERQFRQVRTRLANAISCLAPSEETFGCVDLRAARGGDEEAKAFRRGNTVGHHVRDGRGRDLIERPAPAWRRGLDGVMSAHRFEGGLHRLGRNSGNWTGRAAPVGPDQAASVSNCSAIDGPGL